MDDEYVVNAQLAMEGLSKAVVLGAYVLDFFPILERIPSWVPGATGKKTAEAYAPHISDMRDKPMDEVQSDYTTEVYIPPRQI